MLPDVARCLGGRLAGDRAVEVALVVDADGKVVSATRRSDPEALGACAESKLREAVFAPSARGEVVYVISPRRPPKTTESGVTASRGLPAEVVRRVLRVAFPGLRACRAVDDGDDGVETISLSFEIDETGRVVAADVRGGATDARRACMGDALSALSFPPPEARVEVRADVTFGTE